MWLQKKGFVVELENLLSSFNQNQFTKNRSLLSCPETQSFEQPRHLYSCTRNKFMTKAYQKEMEGKEFYQKTIPKIKDKEMVMILMKQRRQIEDSIREMNAFGANKYIL